MSRALIRAAAVDDGGERVELFGAGAVRAAMGGRGLDVDAEYRERDPGDQVRQRVVQLKRAGTTRRPAR